MADATPTGETGTPAAPKTDATNPPVPTAPLVPAVKPEDTSAVEQLKKELEQQRMRANQLANQLKEKEDAAAAAHAKELEEQEQFKLLYEQEKAKREGIESEIETKERERALREATQSALKDYSDEVRALVEETGLSLTSTDDAEVAKFKEKLEKISKQVGAVGKVRSNNPNPNSGNAPELSADELKTVLKDDDKFEELLKSGKYPGIASMMGPRRPS